MGLRHPRASVAHGPLSASHGTSLGSDLCSFTVPGAVLTCPAGSACLSAPDAVLYCLVTVSSPRPNPVPLEKSAARGPFAECAEARSEAAAGPAGFQCESEVEKPSSELFPNGPGSDPEVIGTCELRVGPFSVRQSSEQARRRVPHGAPRLRGVLAVRAAGQLAWPRPVRRRPARLPRPLSPRVSPEPPRPVVCSGRSVWHRTAGLSAVTCRRWRRSFSDKDVRPSRSAGRGASARPPRTRGPLAFLPSRRLLRSRFPRAAWTALSSSSSRRFRAVRSPQRAATAVPCVIRLCRSPGVSLLFQRAVAATSGLCRVAPRHAWGTGRTPGER